MDIFQSGIVSLHNLRKAYVSACTPCAYAESMVRFLRKGLSKAPSTRVPASARGGHAEAGMCAIVQEGRSDEDRTGSRY